MCSLFHRILSLGFFMIMTGKSGERELFMNCPFSPPLAVADVYPLEKDKPTFNRLRFLRAVLLSLGFEVGRTILSKED